MRLVGTGAVLSESEQPPRGNRSDLANRAFKALEDADAELHRLEKLHETTARECEGMLAAARSEAANIIANAKKTAAEILRKTEQLENKVADFAQSV